MTDEQFIRQRNRGRLQLVLLAAIFLGPLLVAFVLYYGDIWAPEGQAINGQLISPARPLPAALTQAVAGDSMFTDHWTVLVMHSGRCAEPCQKTLYETRQLRRALGVEMDRVERVWLVTDGQADEQFVANEHPDLKLLPATAGEQALVIETVGNFEAGEVFLIDPLGNLMMRFPPGLGMRAIHTDIKRLLKLSRIG